jgi:4'-phosphopantetheinyl transferase
MTTRAAEIRNHTLPPGAVPMAGGHDRLTLRSDEVHVWHADLDRAAREMPYLGDLLSADERARAARFHFAQDRERWVTARSLLRRLLARYLDTDPARLRLIYGAYGKPALEEEPWLRFNLSHSGGIVLFAVAGGREVGVDVERVRDDIDAEDLAPAVFSHQERQALRVAAPGEKNALFFALWTAKEAYIKARGLGFSYPVQQLTVTLAGGTDAILTRSEAPDREESLPPLSLWRLHGIEGHEAALAAEGDDWEPRFGPLLPERAEEERTKIS